MIRPLSNLTGQVYQHIVKPALFAIPPDQIHHRALLFGNLTSQVPFVPELFSTLYAYDDPILVQDIAGVRFDRPVGLSAGYDYDGYLPQITDNLGFGWHTVGSVTHGAYEGNIPPMYGRLPQSKSLWVNKGFRNEGASVIKKRLAVQQFSIPVGVSVGATNKEYDSVEEVIEEYQKCFKTFLNLANLSYFELNISCPNLKIKQSFYQPKPLEKLLKMVDSLQLSRPVFVKMPIDISAEELRELLTVIRKHAVQGIILGNLTKDPQNPALFQQEAQKFAKGGFSGKPTQQRSDRLIQVAYQYAGKDLTIIGTGGIFSGRDAYRKIRLGASLVQLITAMMYEGPQVIGQVTQDLATELKKDGFAHISEAIGVEGSS